MTEDEKAIGVIVGRFQVSKLTDGHCEIFEHVLSKKHQMNLVFLGIPPVDVHATKRNPIPFKTRKAMIERKYPNGEFDIMYIQDIGIVDVSEKEQKAGISVGYKSDVLWSLKLDEEILKATDGNTNVYLYGSRDSFINHYKGRFQTREYVQRQFSSGTVSRGDTGQLIGTSEEFARGCIYTTQKSWCYFFYTVDCAIFTDNKFTHMYLGKKKGERRFRFPGGFLDKHDLDVADAAVREAREETGLICSVIAPLGTMRIEDGRYANEEETIMTNLFLMVAPDQKPTVGDDLDYLELVEFDKLKSSDFIDGHVCCFNRLKRVIEKIRNNEHIYNYNF